MTHNWRIQEWGTYYTVICKLDSGIDISLKLSGKYQLYDFQKPSRRQFSKYNICLIRTRAEMNVATSLKSNHQITDWHKLKAFEILKTSGIDSIILTNISFNPRIQNGQHISIVKIDENL